MLSLHNGKKMNAKRFFIALLSFVSLSTAVHAAQLTLAQRPIYAGGNIPPLVMIDLSKDHQLYFKAYNDYSDLDGDGAIETTYTNSIDYYGYFDSYKCYVYSTANNQFEPSATTTTKYCEGTDAGKWSGNFLNWASMSRIDAVRKLLYGGLRSTDTSTGGVGTTVLERSFLPMDAHSWAKYYNGADLPKLTPVTAAEQVMPVFTSSSSVSISSGSPVFNVTGATDIRIGDQILAQAKNASSVVQAGQFMIGRVTGISGTNVTLSVPSAGIPTGASGTYAKWDISNKTRVGVTLCNVTPGATSGVNQYPQTNTNAPLIRVAKGNYALWASNEIWQCNWSAEHSSTQGGNSSNGNIPLISGLDSSAENPSQTDRGFGTGSAVGEYFARVKVCVSSLLGKENCQQYPDLTFKPIGLLQAYGEKGLMKFGLMTGSNTKNISGGVLRRNVTDFSREVNVSTNGTFTLSTASNNDGKGIVYNINKMRIFGYDYNTGNYLANSANSENCNYQQIGMVLTGGQNAQGSYANEGSCSSWGNPISEIFLESIRYFAGQSATPAFTYTAGSTKDDKLGMTLETWADPLTAANYCSPLNALIFNPAVSSYDGDQMGGISDLGTSQTAAQLTNVVGIGEGVTSTTSWLVGNNGVDASDGSCTAKTLSGPNGLGDATGICPEAPSQKGTYLIAGAAYYAKTNRIRAATTTVGAAVPATDTKSLKVTTYGVQLASNTPSVTVNVNGKTVKIIPSYRVNAGNSGVYASGTIVDFKVISQTPTTGLFYVNWEDSSQGGDFDQDVWGTLSYTVNATNNTISVTTVLVANSSANGQGFGYVISGTNKDGAHFHSGAYGFNYTDPTNITVSPSGGHINTSGGCTGCVLGDPATTVTYTVTGTSGGQLKDPLWYAAKWGGFVEPATGGTGKPDDPSKWDTRLANGAAGSDGVPDNYFFVSNPAALEAAMERAFISILSTSSASSVATNSTSLNTGARIYQARFNANDWSGQVLSYAINSQGLIGATPLWDAGQKLNPSASDFISPTNRVILTYDRSTGSNAGIPFRWTTDFPYKNELNGADTDVRGQQRLNWLRGDISQAGPTSSQLRQRPNSVLGDIVNSNPQFAGVPNGGYADASYTTFVGNNKNRLPMLYAGANDGMVHGFSAIDGTEKIAYIPSSVVPNLRNLTAQSYTHQYYVDASPTVGDAQGNGGAWKTFLIGGLGAGGQGIYALDVTNPGVLNSDGTSTNAFTESNAASIVQWEFSDLNDPDLGFTYGKPTIAKMANGRWAAIFGNGYNNSRSDSGDTNVSSTGHAVLYIVFLDRPAGSKSWVSGTDYIKIDTMAGTTGTPNGLATPSVIDTDGNGVADYVYAGDLLGNMWKFNVRSATTSSWQTAFGTVLLPLPLYTARAGNLLTSTPQPITSAPDVIRNPGGGYVVLFGTGKYIENTDASNTSLQSFYGVWDENLVASPVTRADLVAQTIIGEVTVGTNNFRATSNNADTTKRGWYMDLRLPSPAALQGERVVYDPMIRNGRIIFTTVIPSVATCAVGGNSWLMELDAVTGKSLPSSPIDVNGDGVIDNRDTIVINGVTYTASGRNNPGMGLTPAPTVIEGDPTTGSGLTENKIFSGSSGNTESVLESTGGSSGRLSWREIMQ